jgi:hypothetical protein
MPTRAAESPGIGPAAKLVAEHASAIARLETQLAVSEIKAKLATLGVGVGSGIAAAIFVLFVIGFAAASAAAGLATTMPVWAALLIVTGLLLLIAATFGAVAYVSIKKATPPVPEAAIEEARLTTEVLTNGSRREA